MNKYHLPTNHNSVPIPLYRLGVDKEGQLVHRALDRPVRFEFKYKGRNYIVQFQEEDNNAKLRLVCELGSMPYSIESRQARANLALILKKLSKYRKLHLSQEQRIIYTKDDFLQAPVTAIKLLTSVIRAIVEFAGIIEIIEENLELARQEKSRPLSQRVGKWC